MKTRVTETSLLAYTQLKPLSQRKRQVYHVFKFNPECAYTDKDLSRILNLEINRITPRRGEIADLNLIEKAGWTTQNRRRAQLWRLKK